MRASLAFPPPLALFYNDTPLKNIRIRYYRLSHSADWAAIRIPYVGRAGCHFRDIGWIWRARAPFAHSSPFGPDFAHVIYLSGK